MALIEDQPAIPTRNGDLISIERDTTNKQVLISIYDFTGDAAMTSLTKEELDLLIEALKRERSHLGG